MQHVLNLAHCKEKGAIVVFVEKLLDFFCLNDFEDDDLDFDIKFEKKLSNGYLFFTIIDLNQEEDWTGSYVVVSPSGVATIINDLFDPYVSTMLKE